MSRNAPPPTGAQLRGPDADGYWLLDERPLHCGTALEVQLVTAHRWCEDTERSVPTEVCWLPVRVELAWSSEFRALPHQACVARDRVLVLHLVLRGALSDSRFIATRGMHLRWPPPNPR